MQARKLLDWRKVLIYTHRWSGILLTAVFVAWFASGVVFVYVGMPALSADERLQRMEPLDLSSLRVTPSDAAARAGLAEPARVRVAMSAGRPVYRLLGGSSSAWRMVYADTGEVLHAVSADEAVAIVRRFAPEHARTVRHASRLTEPDQWTLQSVVRNALPLHRVALGDRDGTEYYVSESSGEPVLATTSRGRFWGYLSAVLHWLYFTPLRRHTVAWNRTVVWLSLGGTLMTLLGMTIGVWRLSTAPRYRLRGVPSRSPYARWMKWHHYTGLVFGTFAATWALSGALSLSPFAFLEGARPTRAYREAATGGPIDLTALTVERIRASAEAFGRSFTPKELDFFQFLGEPYFVAYSPPAASEKGPWRNMDVAAATALTIARPFAIVSARHPERGTFTSFDRGKMWTVANAAMPGAPIADATWLDAYDAYYYSHDGQMPLPVLRVRYGDERRTWLYLDPQHGAIASRYDRASRWNRWLYHGLHSLDFPFLYYRRPLWDLVVILLSVGGIAISVTSAMPAWRRLVRHTRARASVERRAPTP